MSGVYYIIEHPTRGCYKDDDWTDPDPPREPQPRFSTSAYRSAENVRKFFHITHAQNELAKFPLKLRAQCKILRPHMSPFKDWVDVTEGEVDD